MGGLQAPQAAQSSKPVRKQVPTFVNLENMPGNILIDPYDNIADISHKKAVNKYVYTQCPAAKEVSLNSKRIDAAVLSLGYDTLIYSLADVTGLPLTKDNLAKYKKPIAAWLRPPEKKNGRYNTQELKSYKEKMEKRGLPYDFPATFTRLEWTIKRGIPVFHSAGNGASEEVDLLSFADGVNSVGALDKNGKKADYSADNSLISIWERGDYPIVQIRDKKGTILGYNITGGQRVEIPLNQTTGRPPVQKTLTESKIKTSGSLSEASLPVIVGSKQGTSFAAPVALGKYLRQKYGKDCDLN